MTLSYDELKIGLEDTICTVASYIPVDGSFKIFIMKLQLIFSSFKYLFSVHI